MRSKSAVKSRTISVARNVVHMPRRLSVSSTPIQRTMTSTSKSVHPKKAAAPKIHIASARSMRVMPVKTFEFSSVDGRRFVKPTDRWVNLRVDHNSTVTLISELGDGQASADFRFTADSPASAAVVGLIQIDGNAARDGYGSALVTDYF